MQQDEGFRNLDRNIQKTIAILAEEHSNFDDLNELICAENTSTKHHISQEFLQHQKQIADREFHNGFLQSLYIPEILSRQEEVAEAHRETFEWIFDASGEKYFLGTTLSSGLKVVRASIG